MGFLPFGLSIGQVIIGVIIILIIGAIFFRRYLSALVMDFILDPVLSTADNFVFGAGLVGLDFGDWIAAFMIFRKEKKISGTAVALFCAWEAADFIPISLIPVLGEIVEVFFNFFPAVTISRALFNKYKPADAKEKILEKEVSIAEMIGLDAWKEKKALKKIKELIKHADPVHALKEADKPIETLTSELIDYTDKLIADANNAIQYILNQNIQAPVDLIDLLQGGINQGEDFLERAKSAEEDKDFETAINSAINAKNAVINAAQQFDILYQQYLAEIQNQNPINS